MITCTSVLDEVIREAGAVCSDCSEKTLRFALETAAAIHDRNFLVCSNCRARWTPNPDDIAGAIRDWLLVFAPGSPFLAAVLCPRCSTANPDPLSLPAVARAVLRHSLISGPPQ